MSLIVTGSIGIDSIEAPTGTVDDVLGGSAIYFAAAASFFGDVRLVGAVGEDFPASFLDTFRHFKVDLAGLEQRRGSKTFRWRGKYHQDMNRRDTLSVELNVLAEKLPPVPQAYRDSQYIFLANTHPAGQLELLAQFPNHRLVVADTMDLWIANERPTLLELLKQVDGLVLNYEESFQLTGKTNIVHAAEAVMAMGPAFVVIKKGEHGAFLMLDKHAVALPAYAARDVVDPTGAGDSFAGGMMGYLATRAGQSYDQAPSLRDLRMAMAYGTIVASYNIEAFSLGRMLKLTRKDLDDRMADYCRMLMINDDSR
ncbi:MAG: PfkB family carbohydrate kinase [Phycisphaeraceae bacterium]